MELDGKTAIVTGAASGMGRATAELLAKSGAAVVASDWNEQLLGEAVNAMTTAGGKVVAFRADVASQGDCEAMVDKATDAFGRLDILVNNAGVMDLNQPVGNLDNAIWRRVLSINLDGPMFATRRAIPAMLKAGGGAIVNIASVAGVGGAAAGAAYTASKHALIGLTLNTAWMYAKRGIRCNAIAAGGVQTNIMESIDQTRMDAEGLARAGEYYTLMPAMLESIDIAELVLFLVSGRSRYINGAVIPADAGWRSA